MGKKSALATFLCGVFSCKKNPPEDPTADPKREDSDTGEEDDNSPAQPTITTPEISKDDEEIQNQLLPPPPGRLHMRMSSCHHQHSRSNSAISKLSSSLSMRFLRQSSKREEYTEEKNLTAEDLVWKKTIILGEKCRVPDEEDDTVLYDEKGNRISTYRPKTSISRQNSAINQG